MTALNILIGYQEAHLFADTGHYDANTKRLDHLADKVFPIQRYKCLLAWSGPSVFGSLLANRCEEFQGDLVSNFVQIVSDMRILQRFSAILVFAGGGITVEEGLRVHMLSPGSVVRSIPADIQLDPDDLKASGVRLMERQRQSSGVVFGQCQYWYIGQQSCTKEVLCDWYDKPEKLTQPNPQAAKIADLTVESINVKYNAITKVNEATGVDSGLTVTTQNAGDFPSILWGYISATYTSAGSGSASLEIWIRRASDDTLVEQETRNWSGTSFGTTTIISLFGTDVGMSGNESYQITYLKNTSGGGGGGGASLTINEIVLRAFYSVL